MKTSLIALGLAGLLLAGGARADFTLDRETTLGDDFGGQFHSVTTGTLAAEGAQRDTVATFSNFHPRAEATTVDGQISRHFERIEEQAARTYDGDLSIVTAVAEGEPRSLTLRFEALTVTRGDDGATLSGTLVVNDQSIDAAQTPGVVKAILLRLIRFLHY
ncbi:MAG: hypothetical protein NW204_15100 [Xanthomonadaceae bacterium]|nr:hypothetical protein [Xanthomonadaceae bacterium]